MRSSARPFFHASAAVPLTGREPIVGRLRGRLEHRGRGWGQVVLQGPRAAGISRLLDECERLLAAAEERPFLRVRPTAVGAPPLEGLRRAFLAALPRLPRDELRASLEAVLGRRAPLDRLLVWVLDGPTVGALAPESEPVRDLLRALVPGGPVLVDDLSRIDADSRRLLLGEGTADGIGLLAGNTAGAVGPREACWPLDPLGEHQLELLLRRWLRHPVTVRRLTPLLHRRTGGWPGAAVRAVRQLARVGAFTQTPRGVAAPAWPPPFERAACPPVSFGAWAEAQPTEVRRLLTVAALQGDPEDDHFLARAASVRLRVVTDTRAEVDEVFPDAAGRLLPGETARLDLVRRLDGAVRQEAIRSLHRTWSRRREEAEPRAPSRAARLRVAVLRGDMAAAAAALARYVAVVPSDAGPDEEGRALLTAALDLVPEGAMGVAGARRLLTRAPATPAAAPGLDLAGRARRHEELAERAAARGRMRARAAHLGRAARLHEAQGTVAAAADAWRSLGGVEVLLGRKERAFEARVRAARAFDGLGDASQAAEVRQLAAELGLELATYDRAVELLRTCLAGEEGEGGRGARRASIHLSLARAHHGRGDLEAERRHARAALDEEEADEGARLGATARLLLLRLRAGEDEVTSRLADLVDPLDAQGLAREATEVRRLLAHRHHLDAEIDGDAEHPAPAARLRLARRHLLAGRTEEGRGTLLALADDPSTGIEVRVEALARLAHARLRSGDESGAHEAACRADALLELGRRSRADDATLHHLLAVAFGALGELGRAIRHRRASRTAQRRGAAPAESPPAPTLSPGSGAGAR